MLAAALSFLVWLLEKLLGWLWKPKDAAQQIEEVADAEKRVLAESDPSGSVTDDKLRRGKF